MRPTHVLERMALLVLLAVMSGGVSAQAGALMEAVEARDIDAVQAELEGGADVDAAEPDGTTSLMWASAHRMPEIVRLLLRAGANVEVTNYYGVFPLYLAVRSGDVESVRALLAAGADASSQLASGETVLMTASRVGSLEIVRMLLAGGVEGDGSMSRGGRPDVNAIEGWYGQTALMWAAAGGHPDVVHALVEAGANVDAFAIEIVHPNRWEDDVALRDPQVGGLTALHMAAREGHVDAVEALVESGADLDAVDPDGMSPTMLALLNGHMKVAVRLLTAGADPNLADRWGRTALMMATDLNTLDVGARPGPITGEWSPVDVVRAALSQGADPNIPLQEAYPRTQEQPGVNPVLQAGATPFFRAAMSADLEIMKLLLEAGADPHLATKDQTTPLHVAAGVGWREGTSRGSESDAIEAIGLLIELGADVNAENDNELTPLRGAERRGSRAILEFLTDHGAEVR